MYKNRSLRSMARVSEHEVNYEINIVRTLSIKNRFSDTIPEIQGIDRTQTCDVPLSASRSPDSKKHSFISV